MARAFIAKAVYNMDQTRQLIDRLKISPALRRICGWQKVCDIPHELSFLRAFKEFSESGLAETVHENIIKECMGDKIIGHISRDSTSIDAWEKPVKKVKVVKPKRKRGRPRKGEVRKQKPTRFSDVRLGFCFLPLFAVFNNLALA
ncbi:MAG: transposase [Desulfobacteraceae bacterium]|nr:transposase [Desulfobacteraceae bacterium]